MRCISTPTNRPTKVSPTDQQIEEQINFEKDAIRLGVEKLRKNTKKLEDKNYASASVYGNASISELLPHLVRHLSETRNRIKKGRAGQNFKEIYEYLEDLDSESACLIALKVTFDCVFGQRSNSHRVVNVTQKIGAGIEDECHMRYYEREYPDHLRSIKKHIWHSSMGTHQKMRSTTTLINRNEEVEEWKSWNARQRTALGGWMLDAIMQISGWFEKEMEFKGKKTIAVVKPTEAFIRIQSTLMDAAELYAPLRLPMLCEPKDWHPIHEAGGYYLNSLRKNCPMVRHGNPALIQGDTPVDFLNRIQKTAYRVNTFVADVAEYLFDRRIKVGKFIPIVEHPQPPKPVDIDTNFEARKDYRRRAAEAYNLNAQSFKKSIRTRMTMEVMRMFRDRERWYVNWSFCYRGRVYPIPAFLTPQSDEFGKSLIQFADGSFMTPEAEEWLAFQVATTYGLDKSTMAERQEWVKNNHELIHAVATDPLGNLDVWTNADEPWLFLAACEEFNACVLDCTRHFTHLPVAVDASCSGIQVLSGLARDRSAAQMVNVTPSASVQDAYAVIAEHSKPRIPSRLHHIWDRKCTKRCVMTIPYSAKPFSNRSYIRDAIKEKGEDVTGEELTEIVKAVRASMHELLPGPLKVLAWIEKEVGLALKRGATHLEWTTPSGFNVYQKLNKHKLKQVDLQLMGKCQIWLGEQTDKVDVQHHKNATSPNLVHSLDSSLLHLAMMRWEVPIALIHDSVLCRATDMSQLSTVIRETYKHLFADHSYLEDWATQIGAESDPPIIGDLKPENVMASTYFFC